MPLMVTVENDTIIKIDPIPPTFLIQSPDMVLRLLLINRQFCKVIDYRYCNVPKCW